ncbi:MAG: hypothetical protein PHW73_02860 [Atribacterota bacterium]|nr:hypothetical protein [Atribacterota bacterium]
MRKIKQNEILSSHIKIILEGLKTYKKDAVILCGGYGRGEGGWFIEEGALKPYNDYDLLLVLEEKISNNELQLLRKRLATKIGIRWVDITQKTPQELKKLGLSIFNYDLKYASKVIDGDDSILKLISNFNASKLPLKEGEILFFTRLWALVGSFDERGFKVQHSLDDSRFFYSQMAKAILAVVDVLLLMKNKYHLSYKEKIKRFIVLYSEDRELCKLSKWALKEKLNPSSEKINQKDMQSFYNKVHKHFFIQMMKFFSYYYNREVNDVYDIERHTKYSFDHLIRRLGYFMIKRSFRGEKILAIKMAQMFIAGAYEDGNINKELFRKGLEYMRYIDSSIPGKLSWDKARILVAQMRNEM